MRSIAVEAIKTIPNDSNWTYLEHEVFGPRLPLDIPQVAFSFVSMYMIVFQIKYYFFAISYDVNLIQYN